jgi:hypothetical protein
MNNRTGCFAGGQVARDFTPFAKLGGTRVPTGLHRASKQDSSVWASVSSVISLFAVVHKLQNVWLLK